MAAAYPMQRMVSRPSERTAGHYYSIRQQYAQALPELNAGNMSAIQGFRPVVPRSIPPSSCERRTVAKKDQARLRHRA